MLRIFFAFWLPRDCCFRAPPGELSDRRAPGFALPDPAYERYYDLQDYAGKVVIIDIMSTRCPHCLLASTTLEQVKARYGDKVAILEVVLPPDNQDTIASSFRPTMSRFRWSATWVK